MNQFKLLILQAAKDDLTEIYFYVAADDQSAALKMTDQILDAIDTLAQFPFKGKAVPDAELAKQEFRMLVVKSYIVFYKIINEVVYVYRILRGERDYPHLL